MGELNANYSIRLNDTYPAELSYEDDMNNVDPF